MKKFNRNSFITMLGLVICAGCTTVKRYRSAEYKGEDNKLVMMHLTGARIEPEAKDPVYKDLWSLSDHGQQALINSLDKRNTDNDKYLKALNGQYMKKDDGPSTIDFTSKNLKMIFTISKKRAYETLGMDTSKFSPADRIEYLKYNLEISPEMPLKFQKWNQYTTQYGTVSIADMTFSKSLSATAGYGASGTSSNENKNGTGDNQFTDVTKSATTTPSIGLSGSASSTEAQKIQYRYIQLNGNLDDKHIYMEEEGMREIDLTGNVTADVALKFDENLEFIYKISALKTDAGLYNKTDALKIVTIPVKLPNLKDAPAEIKAKLTFEYVYRHVKPGRGERTFFEYDDKVQYYKGKNTKEVTIFKKADYLPQLFYIGKLGPQKSGVPKSLQLKIKDGGSYQPLRFASMLEANEFYKWAANYPCDAADVNTAIKWGPYELFAVEDATATIVPVTKTYLQNNLNFFSVLDYYQ
jgi:hypothetical protein